MQFGVKLKLRTILTTSLLLMSVYILLQFYEDFNHPKFKTDNDTKLVLTYTTLWGGSDWYIGHGSKGSDCPYKCVYTNDKRGLEEADALIFHGLSMDLIPVNSLLRNPRAPELWDQIWIFKLNESPLSYPDSKLLPYENTFNWTMTYRRDSDIYAPSGEFMPKNHGRRPFKFAKLDLDDESLQKKKLVASMISNCDSKSQRLKYISLMKEYSEVDDYGRCGTLKCDKQTNYLNCYEQFGTQYKFFLAFENSFCEDYVTEKSFEPLRHGMVPVVRGGGNYSQILPSGSYINTQDFKSVEELVNYLKYLDQNHNEYRKYFKWREFYDINSDHNCELCTKIHEFNVTRDRKSYPNIYSWYHTNYTLNHLCTHPTPLV